MTRRPSAELVPCAPSALRLDDGVIDPLAHQVVELEAVAAQAHRFDVIHWHLDYFHFPLSRRLGVPHATTLHGRLDIPDLQPVYTEFSDMPVVSISNDQRSPLPQANWVATIHHGLPPDMLEPRFEPGEYLAFLGRISPEKRADRAIEIARRTGLDLLSRGQGGRRRSRVLREARSSRCWGRRTWSSSARSVPTRRPTSSGHASALLFPIDWAEPFGLVMIESMACATPVVAYRTGSVPEVITDGVSGFVVDDLDGCRRARWSGWRARSARGAASPSRIGSRWTEWRATTSPCSSTSWPSVARSDRAALPVMADQASV